MNKKSLIVFKLLNGRQKRLSPLEIQVNSQYLTLLLILSTKWNSQQLVITMFQYGK